MKTKHTKYLKQRKVYIFRNRKGFPCQKVSNKYKSEMDMCKNKIIKGFRLVFE